MPESFDFMNSPNFGAEGGVRANQAAALNSIAIGNAPLQTGLLQARINQSSATALNESAEAGLKQAQLKEQQNEALVMQNMAKQQQTSPAAQEGQALNAAGQMQQMASHLLDMSSQLYGGGAPVAGAKVLKQAMDLSSKIALISKSTAQASVARLSAEAKGVEFMSSVLGNAGNQDEWNAGVQKIMANPDIPVEEKQDLMKLRYSPAAVKAVNDQALTYKQKADLAIKQATADATIRDKQSAMAKRSFDENWGNIQKKEDIRAAAVSKNKPPPTVPGGVIRRATDAIMADRFPGVTFDALPTEAQKQQVRTAALRVAEQMRAMQQGTGMTESEAQTRAIAADRKNWVTLPGHWGGADTTVRSTQNHPLPWAAAPDDRVNGAWYPIPGKGYSLKWDATKKLWSDQ